MVKTKPNQKIHVDKLNTTLDKLSQLKEKPKEELTLRESIYVLRDKLKSALKKGYSYQDLSEILEEQEILISASTLKQYLTEISKESSNRRKRKKSVKSNNGNSSDKTNNSKFQAELIKSSSENTTLSRSKSNKDSERIEPGSNDEIAIDSKDDSSEDSELPTDKRTAELEAASSSSVGRKSAKNKPKGLSSSNRDLSSDFNQY